MDHKWLGKETWQASKNELKVNLEKKLNTHRNSIVFLWYFIIYLFYLSFNRESERMHWITLVIIPIAIMLVLKKVATKKNITQLLSEFGFKKSSRGIMILAICLSLLFFIIQLRFSRNSKEIISILNSPGSFLLLIKALFLVLFTAGFTEEFFFRGIMQTSVGRIVKIRLFIVLIGAVIFSLYHVPYAYFNPGWPSHGNFYMAIKAAFSEAMVIGLILGFLFEYSGKSLWPCILLHSMINLLPVVKLLHNS